MKMGACPKPSMNRAGSPGLSVAAVYAALASRAERIPAENMCENPAERCRNLENYNLNATSKKKKKILENNFSGT